MFIGAYVIITSIVLGWLTLSQLSDVKTTERKDESSVIYVNSKSEDLAGFKQTVDKVQSKFNKRVIAVFPSEQGYYSLHTDDGTVYWSNKEKSALFTGNFILIDSDLDLLSEARSKVYFEGNNLAIAQSPIGITAKIDSNALSVSLKDKLNKIKNMPVPVPERPAPTSPTSHVAMNESHDMQVKDQSCLITFGGFDQPKMGYDEDCQKLSHKKKQEQVKAMMTSLPDEFFIKHKAENEKSEIYVFTDYTCGYCKKLHRNMDSFLEKGVSVNYIMFPRAVGNPRASTAAKRVVDNMNSAWCSTDQIGAMHTLYTKGYLNNTECNKNDGKLDSPVRQHYILGMMFDISGTPLIVGSNGLTTYGFGSVSKTLRELSL